MDKNLKVIQTLAKVGQVLCKIAWICGIIGAAGCAIGILSLMVGVDEILKIGGVTIHGIIANESGASIGTMYSSMTVAMILSIGELILAKFAEQYFKNEVTAGTPFTQKGASELQRLGILTICIPLGAITLAEIAYQIMNYAFENVKDIQYDDYTSVGLGVAFIVMSVIFRYGASLESKKEMEEKELIEKVNEDK